MKVSRADQRKLLDLQEADLQITRLQYRIQSDPLREKLAEMEGRADDLRRSVIAQKADLMDRSRKITELAADIQKVEDRRVLQQERLDSGKIPLRDMGAVEHEIQKIRDRKEQLELDLLELEDDFEKRQKFLADTEISVVALAEDEQRTKDEMAIALSRPTDELGVQEAIAKQTRADLPDSVLEEYDYLRGRMGDLVVLRFEDGALRDAPVSLTMEERGILMKAPEDELFESEDTGYLIVRV